MCGIVGIRRFDGARVDPERLRALADVLTHRGPDGAGVWISADGTAGLAHRRLSIIDVAGSPQPMSSVDGRVHVVFNGEIFNYRELRDALDYPWRTAGDTEVLLAGFLEGGPGFVERLRGQFAYGIVDERDGQLWLHRDRLGILPLYWYRDEDVLVFASEIKAILPALPRAPEVDEESLADYLAHRSVPTPHTMFRGVRKLPPGHRLLARPDGRVTVERYWALPVEPAREHVPDAEALTLVGEALRDSVRAALVADVPVGAYLSGGIDSSLIVAMISSLREGEGVETFSANFEQTSHDELPFARKVSAHLGTTHHEITVTARDFEQLWPKLTWHVDAPLPEPPDIAFHRLATLARRHVKVVLSGEGSDELFAGYPKYRYARLVQASGTLPAAVRGPVFGALERALPDRARRPRTLLRAAAARTEAERFRTWFAPFTAEERLELAGSAGRGGYEEIWRRAWRRDPADALRRLPHLARRQPARAG
ncbi:MAG: asparagine synthase (glutamine-hydrolyzing) [Acidimicrobiia bacterium]|nr:asparagine synthase (glutamine-hydrolyzing) [Acidimicrobiia bacterium]